LLVSYECSNNATIGLRIEISRDDNMAKTLHSKYHSFNTSRDQRTGLQRYRFLLKHCYFRVHKALIKQVKYTKNAVE